MPAVSQTQQPQIQATVLGQDMITSANDFITEILFFIFFPLHWKNKFMSSYSLDIRSLNHTSWRLEETIKLSIFSLFSKVFQLAHRRGSVKTPGAGLFQLYHQFSNFGGKGTMRPLFQIKAYKECQYRK